jgi:hypothetical protein
MAASSLASSILGQNFEVSLVYAQVVELLGSAKTRVIYLIRRNPGGRWLCEHKLAFWTIVVVWTLISTVLKAALIASLFNRLFNSPRTSRQAKLIVPLVPLLRFGTSFFCQKKTA